MTKKPFFARFLEGHLSEEKTQEVSGGVLIFTKKYPSDDDEIFTKKYPSDNDEG